MKSNTNGLNKKSKNGKYGPLFCSIHLWKRMFCENRRMRRDIIRNGCEHFETSISIYTLNNYVAWIIGPRDRISFYMNAKL